LSAALRLLKGRQELHSIYDTLMRSTYLKREREREMLQRVQCGMPGPKQIAIEKLRRKPLCYVLTGVSGCGKR
jgi:hypothetical protein